MKTISGIEFASEHNGTDVFRVIELAYEQGQKDGHSEQLGTNLISRQALLDKFEPWLKVKDYNDGELNMLKAILYEIRFMRSAQPEPSQVARDIARIVENENDMRVIAQPERIKGRWERDGHHIKCDQCGMYMCDTDREGDRIPTEFCPNCGAKMEGEDE